MEGFLTPQSNKRRAGLPIPYPVSLQSCCSAPRGSPPLRLCWDTALHWIHVPPGPLCLGPHWIHAPLESPPVTPSTPQALLDPSPMWDNQSHTPLGSSPLGPGTSLAWDNHIIQSTRIPAPQVEQGPSCTCFPDNCSTRLPLGPPLEGSKHA
jgi:hypothetical protein